MWYDFFMSGSIESQTPLEPFYALHGHETTIADLATTEMATLKDGRFVTISAARAGDELLVIRQAKQREDGGYFNVRAATRLEQRIRALQIGRGESKLEQIVTHSLPDLTVVTRHTGPTLDELAAAEVQQLTDRRWGEVADAITRGFEKGLSFDTDNAANATFRPDLGITLIDYVRPQDSYGKTELTPGTVFCSLIGVTLEAVRGRSAQLDDVWRQAGQVALAVAYENYPETTHTATVYGLPLDYLIESF